MERVTPQQRLLIVQLYNGNERSYTNRRIRNPTSVRFLDLDVAPTFMPHLTSNLDTKQESSPQLRNLLLYKRHVHLDTEDIAICAAVRTPWGKPLGQLKSTSSSHLCSVAVEAAVKQSGAPLEKLHHVYVAKKPCANSQTEYVGELLKKATIISVREEGHVGLKSLLMGIEALKTNASSFVVVAGVESDSERLQLEARGSSDLNTGNVSSQTYGTESSVGHCRELHSKAAQEGLFEAELVTLKALHHVGKRRVQLEITQDELSDQNNYAGSDGAAALVLTTAEKVKHYGLKPLAAIKGIALADRAPSLLNDVNDLVQKVNTEAHLIEHWEIDNRKCLQDLSKHFKISSNYVNPYGSSLLWGQSPVTSMFRMLTHMAHSLQPNKLGCLTSVNWEQSLAILLEKLPNNTPSGTLPQLTLLTKDPCHLCDILLEELETHFPAEYDLNKVFIDTKENVRYLRLYRHDIPVLYLNGQYLCMHRLNIRLLRRKLDLLKQQQQ